MIHEGFSWSGFAKWSLYYFAWLGCQHDGFDIDNVANKVRKCAHTEDNRDREKNNCQANAEVYTMHVSHSWVVVFSGRACKIWFGFVAKLIWMSPLAFIIEKVLGCSSSGGLRKGSVCVCVVLLVWCICVKHPSRTGYRNLVCVCICGWGWAEGWRNLIGADIHIYIYIYMYIFTHRRIIYHVHIYVHEKKKRITKKRERGREIEIER